MSLAVLAVLPVQWVLRCMLGIDHGLQVSGVATRAVTGLLCNDVVALPLQYLIIMDGSPSVPDQLRRMMAWETIGGLAIFWR